MTIILTDLQHRILELIVENFDAGLGVFNRVDTLEQDLEPGATITEIQCAITVLEKKRFIARSSAKSYSPTSQGRNEI